VRAVGSGWSCRSAGAAGTPAAGTTGPGEQRRGRGLAVGSVRRRRQPFVVSCAGGGTGLAGDLAQVGEGSLFVVECGLVVGVQE